MSDWTLRHSGKHYSVHRSVCQSAPHAANKTELRAHTHARTPFHTLTRRETAGVCNSEHATHNSPSRLCRFMATGCQQGIVSDIIIMFKLPYRCVSLELHRHIDRGGNTHMFCNYGFVSAVRSKWGRYRSTLPVKVLKSTVGLLSGQ